MNRDVAGTVTTYFIVKDQLGSILQLVDQNGNVAQDIEYDEFGNMTLNSNPNFQPLGFAAGIYDPDTKLTRFGVRDYNPNVGRWVQRDPIKFQGGDTNLYAYVGNDPVNFIDPSGEFLIPVAIGIGIFLNATALETVGAAFTEIYQGAVIATAGIMARLAPVIASIRIQGPQSDRIIGSTIKINGQRRPFFRLDHGTIDKTQTPTLHYHTPWNHQLHRPIDPFIFPNEVVCPTSK